MRSKRSPQNLLPSTVAKNSIRTKGGSQGRVVAAVAAVGEAGVVAGVAVVGVVGHLEGKEESQKQISVGATNWRCGIIPIQVPSLELNTQQAQAVAFGCWLLLAAFIVLSLRTAQEVRTALGCSCQLSERQIRRGFYRTGHLR